MQYEIVIGLEVHCQLSTESKIFAPDSNKFGSEPNTNISVITLGHPGVLPKLNKKAVEYAIRMGLACNCEITRNNYFDRKNYFYPDLPKGYQISQDKFPICRGGNVTVRLKEGKGFKERTLELHHIHLEEDAGKSVHEGNEAFTRLDYNRAGTPLIEIVSEPCMRSGEEAGGRVHVQHSARDLLPAPGRYSAGEGQARSCAAAESGESAGTQRPRHAVRPHG